MSINDIKKELDLIAKKVNSKKVEYTARVYPKTLTLSESKLLNEPTGDHEFLIVPVKPDDIRFEG